MNQRASAGLHTVSENAGVDHRRLDAPVARKFLDRSHGFNSTIPIWEFPIAHFYTNRVGTLNSHVADNVRTDVPSGVARAFDARTGALRWAFDLAPPGFDYATRPTSSAGYALGSPNVWAPMAVDVARDLLFVPTGNPAPD